MDIFEKLSIIILPILVTALLGSIITRKHKDKEIFNDAIVRFRSIIAKEISEFQVGNRIDPMWDKSHLKILYAGMVEFKSVLPSIKQKALDELWQEYEKQQKKIFNSTALKALNEILYFTDNLHK